MSPFQPNLDFLWIVVTLLLFVGILFLVGAGQSD